MKKILVLDTGNEWGGGTNSLLELLKRADRERYDFTALFYNNYKRGPGPDIKTALDELGVDFIHLELKRKFYSKAVKEVVRGVLSPLPFLKKRYIDFHHYTERVLPASEAIASILEEGSFDLLYMNNQPSSNLEGILAARKVERPCLQHARIEVNLTEKEALMVNQSVSKVICVSKGVRNALVRSGVKKEICTVVHNGIDTSATARTSAGEVRRELGIGKEDFVVGTVCSLMKRKRVDVLIEAVAILSAEGIPVRCVVAGAGPEEGRLRALSETRGLGDRVVFTGFYDDPLSLMGAMDVFTLPSEKEGLPRVILEAMLMERPVVASRISGVDEVVSDGKTGLLVEPGSARALAAALKGFFDSPEKRAAMGREGRKQVAREFSMEAYVRGVEGVFDEVFDGL